MVFILQKVLGQLTLLNNNAVLAVHQYETDRFCAEARFDSIGLIDSDCRTWIRRRNHIISINSVSKSIVKFSEFLFHFTRSAVNLTHFFCNLFFFLSFQFRLRYYQFLLPKIVPISERKFYKKIFILKKSKGSFDNR